MSDGGAIIGEAEAARLLLPLAAYDAVLLAVSGGPDSMALLDLAARWSRARTGPPCVAVATVDHGLRSASADEARVVACAAKELGLEHTTLVWQGEKPSSGLQEAARKARYDLLVSHARRLDGATAAVVTAHTANDQAETLLMRLARGSGVDGLAGMRERRQLDTDGAVVLLRPLLGVTRDELRAHLLACGVPFVEDPSNRDERFERIRLRSHASTLAALGLDAPRLALSARRLARASAALATLAGRAWAAAADVHGGIYLTIDRDRFRGEPAEIRLRLIERGLDAFGGNARPPRLSEIETLEDALARERKLTRTLGGCVVSAGPRVVRIYREPGRDSLPRLQLTPGITAVWDRRFRVTAITDAAETSDVSIEVRPLGLDAPAVLARHGLRRTCPMRALQTLPAFWIEGHLAAVPQLGIGGAGSSKDDKGHVTCRVAALSEFVAAAEDRRQAPDAED